MVELYDLVAISTMSSLILLVFFHYCDVCGKGDWPRDENGRKGWTHHKKNKAPFDCWTLVHYMDGLILGILGYFFVNLMARAAGVDHIEEKYTFILVLSFVQVVLLCFVLE